METFSQKIKRKVKLQIRQKLPFSLPSPCCVIFLYHTVEEESQPWTKGHRYVTHVENFKNQIQFIQSHFEIVSSTELIEKLKTGNITKNTAAIHFDDGFQTYYDVVIPFLKEQKIHSTIFLIDSVLNGEVPIRNKLAFCLNSQGREELLQTLQDILQQDEEAVTNLFIMTNPQILSWAKQALTMEMEKAIETIYPQHVGALPRQTPFFDQEAALKLRTEPYVEFGSHTVNHLMLSKLDEKTQRHEIIEGHQRLETLLDMEVEHFAYPHGGLVHFNETSKRIVQEHQKMVAYSSYGGLNYTFNSTDLKRITLSNHSSADVKVAVLQHAC
ncbi:MAG: polysaccharide deacetylase family protein [SAR324 cluster bacterium]|nr:polysaccharide deacetylase family protein [SAR324 cluster bacterium]